MSHYPVNVRVSPLNMTFRQRLWLCLSLVPWAADVGVTLVGQPTAYWNGNYGAAVEWNPLALSLLQYHPLAFVGVSVAVAAGSCAFLLGGPNWLAVVLAFTLILGHSLGVCSWLLQLGWAGWLAALTFLLLMERLVEVCWRRAGVREEAAT